jgi:hypothetical protein
LGSQYVLVCELQVRVTELVKQLEKKAKGCTKYQNTLGQTPQDVLEAQPKMFNKVHTHTHTHTHTRDVHQGVSAILLLFAPPPTSNVRFPQR